ncbi:MAG: GGDEF domain-containing protein [Candidatus Glassbacteria bacterium]|nr:GGDEF domain-containing protein [Candidatus Glassbacteria bacterium]
MAITKSYYKNLLNNLHDGMLCVDLDRKITFWNKSAEHLTGFSEKEVLGKDASEEVMVHFDEQGRRKKETICQLGQTMADGKPRKTEFFFKHRQGHFMPVLARISPIKDSRQGISGAVQVFSDNTSEIETQRAIDQLEKQALIDPLTGLANRRYIDKVLDNKIDETHRYGLRFGLLFIDIDHFKTINDTYGHQAGDLVLQTVSNTMSNVIRSSDILGRWGGEEFVVVVLNVQEKQLAAVAEKMRESVAKTRTEYKGRQIEATISLGAAISKQNRKDTKEDLLKRADDLMYTSKLNGRNQVSTELRK